MTSLRLASWALALAVVGCGDERRAAGSEPGGTDAHVDANTTDAGHDSGHASDSGTDGGSAVDASVPTGEPAGLVGITAAHNAVRANASPTPSPALSALTWSDTIAAAARTWANGCAYGHSNNPYGENIYASTGTPTAANVTSSWASESADYDYAANTCSADCGHYTQIVWRNTTSLGCAIKACSTNSPFDVAQYGPNWTFVVCDYSPAGNVGVARPY